MALKLEIPQGFRVIAPWTPTGALLQRPYAFKGTFVYLF